MHWAFKTAKEIIERRGDLDVYTIACGMTPSGSVHIGNYREFITNYYVAKALRSMGKTVRMIFSWDDYDRFRKVPANITVVGFEQHIGKPVSAVPNPFGEGMYGKHHQQEFEAMLGVMHDNFREFPVEFVYQTQKYTSGCYNGQIIHALKKRKQIYDIITSFKTQGGDEGQRENYYPVSVNCGVCGKDFVDVVSFDEKTNILEYKCLTDNTTHKQDVATANNIKLVWKVDWPMRWQYESVVFEAAGIDHHSENGSFSVGRRIAREIFGYPEPETCTYAWVGIKGVSSGNMSSSSGVNITPQQLLRVYEPEIIRWLFAKYHHEDSFDFGFDDIVARHYMEFDRMYANFDKLLEYDKTVLNLALFEAPKPKTSFSDLVTLVSVPNLDPQIAKQPRFEKAKFWLENYMPDKIFRLLPKFNTEFFNGLDDKDKIMLENVVVVLEKHYPRMMDLFAEMNIDKTTKQRVFWMLYNMLFGRNEGPALTTYFSASDKRIIFSLLTKQKT